MVRAPFTAFPFPRLHKPTVLSLCLLQHTRSPTAGPELQRIPRDCWSLLVSILPSQGEDRRHLQPALSSRHLHTLGVLKKKKKETHLNTETSGGWFCSSI